MGVKHVNAELVFWRHPDHQPVISDFTKSNPEECMAAGKKLDERHCVHVQDLRGRESQFTLNRHGFQYVEHAMPGLDKVEDEEHVKNVIIPKTEQLVQQVTGARKTITFTHRVRCFATDDALLAANRAPAHSVHSDFTRAGALRLLETIIPDIEERERVLTGRVQIINVWRPLKTIRRDPLAVCDWSTLDWRNAGIANRIITPSGWHELGKYAFHPEQRWYYLNEQQPHEALIFQQFDNESDQQGGRTLPHTAFVDPASETGLEPARESIEIKMFAF
ncbi:hypothetical protein N7512_006818 [Penicillium capsulatum]|nr:hypothetical protein N7512_006818 [Penicillium capsulatum]